MNSRDIEMAAEANANKLASVINWWLLVILASSQIIERSLDNWMPRYLASGISFFVAGLMIYGFKSARRRYSFLKIALIALLFSSLCTVAFFGLALIFNRFAFLRN